MATEETDTVLARIFKDNGLDGFEGFSLGNYVCTAFWESHFKSHKVRQSSEDGKDYGIFQINSFKWCNDDTSNGKTLQGDSLMVQSGVAADVREKMCLRALLRPQ
ncbi:lysozyme C-like [Acipenser oxyrinchus oxyrinchus]|uniref:lysozyme n=1 Tax=Acipenser oxyrinchus oxyrinchus TaxID=40147 RepID=A0AAD8G8G3_ACIOX|nr:lysozyme C-like [Acipenser oxyrinchus oxyrinchus]